MAAVASTLRTAPLSMQLPVLASRRLLWLIGSAMGLFLLWAATFSLDKVTRGDGKVLAAVQNQIVQHLEGGIVDAVMVKEGQRVRKGDVLMRIKNQFTEAELSNARTDVSTKTLTLARMAAEVRGDSQLVLPASLVAKSPDIAATEQAVFQSRKMQLRQQTAILDDQARGLQADLAQAQDRLTNLREEETLIAKQLSALERALVAEAVSEHEVLDKRSDLQQLRTRIAETNNGLPKTLAELSEVKTRRHEVWTRFVSETKEKMAQLRLESTKTNNALGAFQDRNSREDLRAPMDGVINKLHIQTIGGVVRSGDPLVEIVPSDHSIIIEARLAPKDRGQVWPGLPATVKISAYDYAIYGGLEGKLTDISADVLQDAEGKSYYRLRLEADVSRFGKSKPVVPGMTAEVDIRSGKHTVLQYLMQPVSDLRDKALRE
jgi:membrane fusion protein, adhesin transport system